MNGRNPPPLLAGGWFTLRGDSMLLEFTPEGPIFGLSAPVTPDERLLPLGGLNGRNPPLFEGGRASLLGDCMFPLARAAPPNVEGRLLLLGAGNGRYPPRLPF